jgi:hypothetical protein
MLAFWGVFSPSAYHLFALGVISIVIAAALYSMSKWAYWLGLFTFPLLLVEFAYALIFSVNLVGWYPNFQVGLLNASLIIYLILLCFSFLLLIDRRNVLKNDRVLDRLRGSLLPSAEGSKKAKQTSAT